MAGKAFEINMCSLVSVTPEIAIYEVYIVIIDIYNDIMLCKTNYSI